MSKKKVIISVISDLVTDQRVHRAAITLHKKGFEVVLVGRRLKNSLAVSDREYKTIRFKLLFERGPLFYAAYNIRLFFYLIFHRADYFLANDLDTLLANFIVSKLKGVKLIYDSHEYFTEVPELTARPFIRSVWMKIEGWIFPKLKKVMTVNDSIAQIYSEKYSVNVKTVRNLPFRNQEEIIPADRKQFKIPTDQKVFLFQGAGINIDRGAEDAMEAIKNVNGAVLLFIGSGDVIAQLKKKAAGLPGKVFFIPKQPMSELKKYTSMADFGLTLDKDTNLNYRYSLPNKLFDYIQSNLPILSSDLIEIEKIVTEYQIGIILPPYNPQSYNPIILVQKMVEMMNGDIDTWKKNLNLAAAELCWENEQHKLLEFFEEN